MVRLLPAGLAACLLLAAARPCHAQDSASARRLETDIAKLSARTMKGRYPGSPQSWQAARYIADRMHRLGLLPLGRSYLEPISPLVRIYTPHGNALACDGIRYRLIHDYIPLPFWKWPGTSAACATASDAACCSSTSARKKKACWDPAIL